MDSRNVTHLGVTDHINPPIPLPGSCELTFRGLEEWRCTFSGWIRDIATVGNLSHIYAVRRGYPTAIVLSANRWWSWMRGQHWDMSFDYLTLPWRFLPENISGNDMEVLERGMVEALHKVIVEIQIQFDPISGRWKHGGWFVIMGPVNPGFPKYGGWMKLDSEELMEMYPAGT